MNIKLLLLLILLIIALLLRTLLKKKTANFTADRDMMSDSEARAAVVDISQNDKAALLVFDGLVSGEIVHPDGLEPGFRALLLVSYSLLKSERIAELDWASGYGSTIRETKRLYNIEDIKFPDEIEEKLDALSQDIQRGRSVAHVVALITPSLIKQGYELLNLNSGSDTYWLFLCSKPTAEKWRNSSLNHTQACWIENPQWQFTETYTKLGVAQEFVDPPHSSAFRQ